MIGCSPHLCKSLIKVTLLLWPARVCETTDFGGAAVSEVDDIRLGVCPSDPPLGMQTPLHRANARLATR